LRPKLPEGAKKRGKKGGGGKSDRACPHGDSSFGSGRNRGGEGKKNLHYGTVSFSIGYQLAGV